MFIPDPGSRVLILSIPYPGSAQKNLGILTPKIKVFLSSRKYDPDCSSRIRILIFLPLPAPGGQKGTGSRIRNTGILYVLYLGDAEGSRPLAPLRELVDLVLPGGGHQAHRVLDDAGVAVPVAHVEGVRVLAHSHGCRLAVVPGKIENKKQTKIQ